MLKWNESASNQGARALGDKARDAGQWAAAVEHYGAHLDRHPDDFGIWVQKGNCAKEARLFDVALAAYDRAVAMNSGDADVHLQRAHALKMQGRRGEAILSYKAALTLDPDLTSAARELNALGVRVDWIAAAKHRSLHIDVTDLLFYLRAHLHVSGIQRVIASFIRGVYQNRNSELYADVGFVTIDWQRQRIVEINIDNLMTVVDIVTSSEKTREEVDAALTACISSPRAADIRGGDVYFIIGAFWVSPSYERILINIREKGVSVGVYIYDLIPVAHRQFVTRDLAEGFTKNLYELTPLCDFAFTISEFVANEYRSFVESNFQRSMPISAVKLAHEIESINADEASVDPNVLDLTRDKYVLCVGTIEIRKNHQYLISAWRRLIDEGLQPPNLVIVGRWGWRVHDLKQQLEESEYLQGRVTVLDSISDPDLAYLYKNCEFSVFPSFVEGWGLPVGESLAYGRPCVASNSSSIPEVGGDFVRYFDPYDLSSGLAIFRKLFTNPAELEDWVDRIRSEFRPVSWAEVTATLCKGLAAKQSVSADAAQRAYFAPKPAWIYPIGTEQRDQATRTALASAAASLVRIKGWHPVETWGSWTCSRNASIRFAVSEQNNTRVVVAMKLKFPLPSQATVKFVNEQACTTELTGIDNRKWHFVTAIVKDGVVSLEWNCVGEVSVPPGEVRPLFLGIEAFGIAVASSVEDRFELLQNIISFEGS
ncbi:glycosyl transferase group 1 [Rhodomicrobium vannielii ATCC 17100]|uniref:Glycosyl transferase group 1 n=1 Tax=Rhodomicrobium vannielii (strain ATCC 17100 / DSM 162 / LMG 4299 / NCIMB 10020 / ATH 3.1.1) TaxID=648757 RepID=E3I5F1_RHOVT|nr:glycosyltransferase [Rhodomicrobium vannielii]ADP71672.1 glycosyl transferase group 1 [Rhodomicrobium vannielii ATCC 17100]